MLEEFISCTVKEFTPENIEQLKEGKWISELSSLRQILTVRDHESYDVYDIWKRKHEYVSPGISDANVILLMYSIIIDDKAQLDPDIMDGFMLGYFRDSFQEKNVLYLASKHDEEKKKSLYVCFAYPLSKRVLDPRQWEYRERMMPDKWKQFIDKMQIAFGFKKQLTKEEKYIMDDDRDLEEKSPMEYTTILSAESIQLDKPYDDIMTRFKTTYDYFSHNEHRMYLSARCGEMHPQEFLFEVKKYLDNNQKDLTEKDKQYILQQMYEAIYEYYKLNPLLDDPKISDIKVIAINDIRVKVGGRRYTSNLTFDDEDDYESFVRGMAIRNGIDLRKNPIAHFVDKDGHPDFILRFNIMTTYVASSECAYIHIRKIAKHKPTMNQLIKDGMLTKELAQWFIEQLKTAGGIIFVGRGGSGKTTLMNVLLEYIPCYRSVMICQDNEELFTNHHPDCMFVHTVEGLGGQDPEEHPVYDLKAITKNGLLVDIDYFVIGEIKGAEAMYFLNASQTGAQCMASLHSGVATLDKLADYVMYESKYSREEALYMLKNIKYIVHMDGYKVQEINETLDWNKEINNLEYRQVYNAKDGLLL